MPSQSADVPSPQVPQLDCFLSPLPLARVLPSGLKATELTQFECPINVDQSLALKLQTLMVLSPATGKSLHPAKGDGIDCP